VKDHVAGIELGVHLHSRAESAAEKILAAYDAGCRRFDSALTGLGGCPFAKDELVGNIATETLLDALSSRGVTLRPDRAAIEPLIAMTNRLRTKYAYAQPVN
jgi:hydroxymethylglutaryl-CoA lyase